MNHYFRRIHTSEDDKDPGFVRLVKIVLAFATLASLMIASVLTLTLGRNDLWVLVTTVLSMSILCGISLFLVCRNVLWTGRVLLPVTILTAVAFLAIESESGKGSCPTMVLPRACVAEIPCIELQKVES